MDTPDDDDPLTRQAVRVLFILYYCCDNPEYETIPMFEEYEKFIEAEKKLHAIDFWVRYPDYFAEALLCGLMSEEISPMHGPEIKTIVRRILLDEEPYLRFVPMQRFFHGAYEPLDDVFCFLSSLYLAYVRLSGDKRKKFVLTAKGQDVVRKLQDEVPEAQWYADRCALIHRFYGSLTGSGMKGIQYSEERYSGARWGELIERVTDRIPGLFQQVFGESYDGL